ncbi:MAG: clostripain-related cysteine peptidase [Vulcanimicrobiota bacterium]
MRITNAAPAAERKKWTVLYYFDGKNNLSPMAKHSFNSIDKVGSDDNVNLVAQVGLMKQDVLRGLVKQGEGTDKYENLGNIDMGSHKSVQEFLEWGIKNYPAERYAVVLWNHGAGFKGVLTDDEHNSIVTNKQLAEALENAQKNTGARINVVNFNACLMNQAEVGYELRNSADFMVGSEEVEAGLRIPIPGLFGTTPQHKVAEDIKAANGDLTGEDVAKLFVYEADKQFGKSLFTPTQSAIALAKMGPVRDAAETLAGALLGEIQKDPSLIDVLRKDIKSAQNYAKIDAHIEPYCDYRDLGDFSKIVARDERFTNPAVKEAAQALQSALAEAIVAETHATVSGMVGSSMAGSTGMSAYIPVDYGFDRQGTSPVDGVPVGGTHGYEKTSFGANSNWEQMLKTIAKDDDLMGRYPKLSRKMMSFGQIARFYGYEFALDAATGATAVSGWNWWPLMGFPYMLPIPGVLAAGAGAVGAAMRTKSGIEKLSQSITRTDFKQSTRVELAVDGAIDTAIGLGTAVTTAALLTGTMNPALQVVAQGTLALALGRTATKLGMAGYRVYQEQNKSVEQKLIDANSERYQPALKTD